MPRSVPDAMLASAMLSAAIVSCSCARSPTGEQWVEITGPTMGTRYSIKIVGLPEGVSQESLNSDIDERLRQINQQMSTYIDDSEVSRFNNSAAGDWFEVSPETALIVHAAQSYSQQTGGAFDITVGPLVRLWHFGPQPGPRSPPSGDQIAAVRRHVGFQNLQVRLQPPALKKSIDGLQIDLSAIAKGYAVDAVASLLDARECTRYLVEIGGELRARGQRQGGGSWRIGIESPRIDRRQIARIVELENVSMATSGDYRNFFEVDGKRYSHTIDPQTGRPVVHPLASVTVLAGDCMTADALATALLVMGPESGLAWADKNGVAALLISRTDEGFTQQSSRSFAASSNSP